GLARFREAHDTLADRVVLLEKIPASSRPAASMRFGQDGKLYVALDDGGEPANAGDLASFSGKILRMNADATTPDDQAGATPVLSYQLRSPRGFDWQPGSETIWIVDTAADDATRLSVIATSANRPTRASTIATYAVPSLAGASAAACAAWRSSFSRDASGAPSLVRSASAQTGEPFCFTTRAES